MASRQEEKERRRREREEREAVETRKASARRRLQLVAGAVLAVAAIAAVVLAISSGGGSSTSDGPSSASDVNVAIPAQKIADLTQASKAAGCEVKTFPSEGRTHLPSDSAKFTGYKTNPPTSGTHRPKWAEDGLYAPGNEPDIENWVHTLEHGRIITQYKPGTPKATRDQLQALFNEKLHGVAGYHEVLMQNNTKMPFAVAAVAWTHYLGCPTMNDKVFDAIRAFRERFVDKGPELIP